MARRPHHVILIVSSDARRLMGRHGSIRAAGYHVLAAPTLDRALALARQVRPTAILTDAALADGTAATLLRGLRVVTALRRVGVVVLGKLTRDEEAQVARDPHAQVWGTDEDEGETAGVGGTNAGDEFPVSVLIDRAVSAGRAAVAGRDDAL